MMVIEAIALLYWLGVVFLVWAGTLPAVVFVLWYSVSFGVGLVNQVRTLGAHRYRNAGEPMDVIGQLLDTVNVPGGPLTCLWAPLGLRFHALHHFLPDLPYHALGRAHARLMSALPADAPYRKVNDPSLWRTLSSLWMGATGEKD